MYIIHYCQKIALFLQSRLLFFSLVWSGVTTTDTFEVSSSILRKSMKSPIHYFNIPLHARNLVRLNVFCWLSFSLSPQWVGSINLETCCNILRMKNNKMWKSKTVLLHAPGTYNTLYWQHSLYLVRHSRNLDESLYMIPLENYTMHLALSEQAIMTKFLNMIKGKT